MSFVDNACYLIFPEIKKFLGLRSVFQCNNGLVS